MALLEQPRRRVELLEGRALARLERTRGSEHAFAVFDRDRRLGGNLLAGALAFRLFGALLPLALFVAVALGYAQKADSSTAGDAAKAVGISSATLQSVAESSRLATTSAWLVGGSALIALLYAAAKAARAVRAAYSLAWNGRVERAPHALRAGLAALAVLALIALVWGGVGRARETLGLGGIVIAISAVVPFAAIWLGASMLLPHADVPWKALLPGAILVGVGVQVIHLGTTLFVSQQIERASGTYGPMGAAFTVLAWMFVISRVIVASAMLNAALWHRAGARADERATAPVVRAHVG